MRAVIGSWGRTIKAEHDFGEPAHLDEVALHLAGPGSWLCYGLGRSYGDVCLNTGGRLISMRRLDRFIAADWESGIVRAEAGMSVGALLDVAVPRGWFLPVVPGTKQVTLGGAVANDVHGKNHEEAGTIGCHVRALGLMRSNGEVLELTADRSDGLFGATIGGLGLTGAILWVEIKLMPIRSAWMETETVAIKDLDAFFAEAEASRDWPCTVAWVDCLATGAALGRGLFTRARPAEHGGLRIHRAGGGTSVPVDLRVNPMRPAAIRAFNRLYAWRPWARGARRMHYDRFFFPLDGISNWNRLYGPGGFYQHQSVVPPEAAPNTIRRLLDLAAGHGQGSFLVVLKMLGERASPGLLSFPMRGATLALDLPNRGKATLRLLDRMADLVLEAGGRIYPAKDATMSPAQFQPGYANWREVESRRDPAVNSNFWRRVTDGAE